MSHSAMGVDSHLEDDLSDDEQDKEVYRSFWAAPEPSLSALEAIAAAGSADEYEDPDDDLINHEDPYLQALLGPADYD